MFKKRFSLDTLNNNLLDTQKDQLEKVINRLDSVLCNTNLRQYQEKIYRISKVLNSIELHSNCFVTRFSLEDTMDVSSNTDDKSSDMSDNHKYEEEEDLKEIDKLIKEVEQELNLPDKLSGNDLSMFSSSNDDEDLAKFDSNYKNTEDKNLKLNLSSNYNQNKKNIHKLLLKIETKLTQYLKQNQSKNLNKTTHLDLNGNNNQNKSMISEIHKTPCIIKKFFEDCVDIDKFKKRYSLRESNDNIFGTLQQNNESKLSKSLLNKKTQIKETKEVTSFLDYEKESSDESNHSKTKEFKKRNSIFQEKFIFKLEDTIAIKEENEMDIIKNSDGEEE